MDMNALNFVLNYKRLLSMIESILQPENQKYITQLKKERPWKLINSNVNFKSDFEAVGFLIHILNYRIDEDMEDLEFDEYYSLIADQWFFQVMRIEFGESDNSLTNNPIIWNSDLNRINENKNLTFTIEIFYDTETKAVTDISLTGINKRSKKKTESYSAIFSGTNVDELIAEIYSMAKYFINNNS